jgi:SAM-dependent methyltransferase
MESRLTRVLKAIKGGTPEPVAVRDHLAPERTRGDFFLRASYRARAEPEYFEDFTPDGQPRVYQPDVYALAGAIARTGARRIVDIGCGKAGKLQPLSAELDIVGVDIGINIDFCRKTHTFGRWIEHDIGSPGAMPLDDVDLRGAVVVCADVIEHVIDPMLLLRKLKTCADRGALVLLSTPERDLVRGTADDGPPKNKAHVREWSLAELRALLREAGFEVYFAGLTLNDHVRRELSTILVFVGAPSQTAPPV